VRTLGDMNVAVSVVLALLGILVGMLAIKLFQKPAFTARADLAELKRAEDLALEALANARKEAEAKATRTLETAEDEKKRAEKLRLEAEETKRSAEADRAEAERIKKGAELEAKAAVLSAIESSKEEAAKAAKEIEELAAARSQRKEEILREKEARIAEKEAELTRRESAIKLRDVQTEELRAEATTLVGEQRLKLEAIAGVSGEQVRKELIEEFLDEARRAAAREGKAIEDLAREEAEKRSKRIIGLAIQRYSAGSAVERTVTSVHLPNDEMKGRIIGRDGRNIRALQETCGVDFIVDDTPEMIVISGFDPIRREVARIALEKLILDGRIHPTRIEEVVAEVRAGLERSAGEAGELALTELGITRVHPELAKLLGRLKYRYSYAQNVLKHSIEVGHLCGLMAAELGQNEELARRSGLLHDIGKAVGEEQNGAHAVVGGQQARKLGEDPIVASAIASHHEDEPATSVIGNLVAAADALSAGRPGARRELLEGYVKRLADLEAISRSFAGVEKSYAIQAGREVRVMVEPSQVSDADAALLAREISKRIEEELTYPGQIRVTVVRETKAVEYAK
jgi:ribonuclease Y